MSKLFDDASLAMIPSAYKDGKLYSIRPTDGDGDFTFSRGSNLAATRVDVNGLIEKGRENLLLQSNTFDTTWGIVGAASVAGGQVGYDGTNDAWLLSKTAAWSNVSQSISNSGVKTFSVYAKANASDWGLLVLSTGATDPVAYFDLVNGVVGVNASNIDAVITPISNGWYRILIIASQTINAVRIYPAEANTASGASGSIYIQDAQLEQGLVATDYIETGASTAQAGILEDLPRLDYSGGASCPSLLLEPSRTNAFTHSEYLKDWTDNNIIRTSNNSVSPEGVKNATLMSGDGTLGVHRFYQTPAYISGTSYTISIFAKAGTNDFFQIYLGNAFDNSAGQVYANFDLSDGSKGTAGSNVDDYDIEDYGNGWYRCYLTAESQISGTTGTFYNLTTSDSVGRAASSALTTNVEFYGAQCEAGSYPTSYIPTYGSAVTRINERQVGIASLPADIADTSLAHTGFIEIKANEIADGGYQVFGLDDASYSNYIKLYSSNTQKSFRLLASASGVSASTGFSPDGGYSKFAWSYDGEGTMKIFMNGSLVTTASITLPTMTAFGFGERAYNQNYTSVSTKQILLFPTALTDSECIALTTL